MRRALLLLLFSVCFAASDRAFLDRRGVTTRARGLPLSERSGASRTRVQPGVTQPLISGAYSSTLLLKPDGTVWSWGANGYGQLGDGTTTGRLQPVNASVLSDVRFLSGGHGNTSTFGLAVTGSGAVYSWGSNVAGQLGDGTTTAHATPAVVPGFTGATQAKAGEYYSTVLKSDGTVWSWGSNGFGQLGNGGYTSTSTPGQVSNLTGVTAVSSWSAFTLALKSDGTVWGWGTDYSGELGDGTSNTNRPLPVQTANLTNVVAITNGWIHGLAVKSDGTLWAWGRNLNGQLGDGTFTNRSVPVQVSGLSSVTAAAGGENHSLALKSDGTVWAWGDNSRGELGDGTTTTRTTPVQVSGLSNIAAISAGTNFSVAVSADGIVYGWGANDVGQIGDWTTTDRPTPIAISDIGYVWKAGRPALSVAQGTYNAIQTVTVNNPQNGVEMHYTLSGTDPTQGDPAVAAGGAVTIDATETLKVAAWKTGYAQSNVTQAAYTLTPVAPAFSPAAGTFTAAQNVTISTTTAQTEIHYTTDGSTPTASSALYTAPVAIGTSTTLKAVALRTNWTPSATTSGTYTMNFGTLPTPAMSPAAGTYTSSADVTLSTIAGATLRYTLNGTDPTTTSTLYAGPFSVMTTSTLTAKAWHPDYAASAVASAAYTIVVATPTLTPGAGTYPAGQQITVATTTPGATVIYTLNGVDPLQTDPVVPASGKLIAGNYTLKAKAWKTGATPSAVASATYTVTGEFVPPRVAGAVFAGFGLRGDGTVWGWGRNDYSCVGDGTAVPRYYPVSIPGLTGVRAIGAGYYRNLALLADGSVAGWGLNTSGEIGDGTTTNRTTPTAVVGLTDAVALASGTSHAIAIRANGTVVTWGYNGTGQLGDGTTTNRTAPVAVAGLTNVTAVAAGTDQTLALKGDGTVWSWGDNAQGQLGDGTTTRRLTPVQVSGLTNVVFIHTGNGSSMAIKADGTVWMWGWNFYGQLGDGTGINRLAPVQMSGVSGAIAGGVGWEYSMVLRNDGTVWTTGRNSEGQLGTAGGDRSTVAQLTGMPAIARVGVGAVTAFAVTADGAAWGWGRNTYENIGDGTSTARPFPVQIAGPGLVWRPWIPGISIASGQYSSEQNPVVSNADPSAVMHYSTTGIDPTEADPSVTAGASIPVTQSLTLKVRSFKSGAPPSEIAAATYTLKVVNPSFSPVAGSYTSAQNVTLSTSTSGTTIRYTVDGRAPTPYSPVYGTPLSITAPTTIYAYATRSGWTSSDVVTSTYWIAPAPTLVAPTISPAAGTYTTERVVSITPVESGASVRYTIDGTDPTAWSSLYIRGFAITQTLTVKARTFKPGYAAGPVASSTFTFAPAGLSGAPSVSPLHHATGRDDYRSRGRDAALHHDRRRSDRHRCDRGVGRHRHDRSLRSAQGPSVAVGPGSQRGAAGGLPDHRRGRRRRGLLDGPEGGRHGLDLGRQLLGAAR
jgi:alpha-tubulin suppressor-like RCC1 family protein